VALIQRSHAQRAATAAERAATDALSQRLGAQALDEKDLQLSLLLAREGVDVNDSAQTRGYLLSALERSPEAIRVFRPLPGRYLNISSTPDGSEFLVGPTDNVQWALVQTATGNVLRKGSSTILALAADGSQIGQVSPDETRASVVDAATGRLVHRFDLPSRFGPNNIFQGSEWSPDLGTLILRLNPAVTPNTTSNTYSFDSATGAMTALPPSPKGDGANQSVWFSPDGRYLVTVSSAASGNAFLTEWRAGDYGRPLRTLTYSSTDQGVAAVAMSHDDHMLAVGGADGSITVFDLAQSADHGRVFRGRHSSTISAVSFAPDDRTLISTGADQLSPAKVVTKTPIPLGA
jgi:WD40 repeat protein